jgi:hypothetical protein
MQGTNMLPVAESMRATHSLTLGVASPRHAGVMATVVTVLPVLTSAFAPTMTMSEVAVALATLMITGSRVPAGHVLGKFAPGARAIFKAPALEE